METALKISASSDDTTTVFADLVQRNRDKSVNYVRRALQCDLDTAEDVAQDAFAIAYEKLSGFRGDSAVDSWFFTILTRRIHHFRRWRGVRDKWRSFIGAAEPQESAPTEGDPPLKRKLAQALNELTPPQRDVFLLVHGEQFTVKEAAQILEIQEGTAKSHLHRSLTNLRKLLEAYDAA